MSDASTPHGHAHAHHHHHDHPAPSSGRAFAIGVLLNLGIVVGEVIYGVLTRSMALLADAGHNLGDVLGLAMAGGAAFLAQRAPTQRRTYGLRRLTLLSALANGVFLLLATGGIVWESVRRLASPQPVEAGTVMVVAALAAVVNGVSALLFLRDREHDLNVKAAFLHQAGDAAIALGVVLSSFAVLRTGLSWIDPVTSLVVSALILGSTWSLLRRSIDLVLDAVPEGVDIDDVRAYLAALPMVREVHDLHVWAMSTTETALTAHLVMPAAARDPEFLGTVCATLRTRFRIGHATLQVDPEDAPEECCLAPEEVV
jgi:cobalt-zinc-cadmium efflux system protein